MRLAIAARPYPWHEQQLFVNHFRWHATPFLSQPLRVLPLANKYQLSHLMTELLVHLQILLLLLSPCSVSSCCYYLLVVYPPAVIISV